MARPQVADRGLIADHNATLGLPRDVGGLRRMDSLFPLCRNDSYLLSAREYVRAYVHGCACVSADCILYISSAKSLHSIDREAQGRRFGVASNK